MPRKDKTFSNKDVLRIYNYYLTSSEAEKVREEICGEIVDDVEHWPEAICFPLFELLDMVDRLIRITKMLYPMYSLVLNFIHALDEVIAVVKWIPVFGEIVARDLTALQEMVDKFDEATGEKIELLDRYFSTVYEYFQYKCYRR